ncbi:unnamed protein product, partial [Rotaria sp. Silwood2]
FNADFECRVYFILKLGQWQ